MTKEKDVVLIYFEDNPLVFARIESISPDIKPNWYHVKFLFFQLPLQVVTWILRDVYIDGEEFTMNGKRIRLEKVVCPEEAEIADDAEGEVEEKEAGSGNSKVIPLFDAKRK